MLSRETEQRLVEIFITISIGEEKINKLKQTILSNLSINPIKLFIKLDINNFGYISKSDFFSFFKSFSINFIPSDIDFIFYFYDKDEDNALCFNEFLDLIISDSNYFYKKSYKKKFKKRGFGVVENGDFEVGPEVEKAVLDILIEEIDLARHLNDLIINLKQCNDFVIQDIFYEIKSYNFITSDSLKAFFDRNEVNYSDKFIKNIFSRFNTKDMNGKICFNKFKSFFDLPFNNNNKIIQNEIIYNNNNNDYINNQIPCNLSQTYVSGDIKFTGTDNNINNNKFINSNSEMNFSYGSNNIQINPNNNEYINNNIHNIKDENYINEEDIQFECNHLSRSGSLESYKDNQRTNCKYISKNENRNNLYRNYLREKRSKSLEKSLSKSICRTNEPISRVSKNNLFQKNTKYIKPIYNEENNIDEYYNINTINDGYNLSKSGSSFHEDLPTKFPVRLDKNLVRRQIQRRNRPLINKRLTYNFCYDDHFEDLKIKNREIKINEEDYYNNDIRDDNWLCNHTEGGYQNDNNLYYTDLNYRNKDIDYNNGIDYREKNRDEKFFSNNLDLKVYQEDISSRINNGKY